MDVMQTAIVRLVLEKEQFAQQVVVVTEERDQLRAQLAQMSAPAQPLAAVPDAADPS